MSLAPEKRKTTSGRSLELTRTYIQRGQGVTRSIWVRVSPKHPLLKAVMALPVGALALTMLLLILIILGFTLLAMALMGAMSRAGRKGIEELESPEILDTGTYRFAIDFYPEAIKAYDRGIAIQDIERVTGLVLTRGWLRASYLILGYSNIIEPKLGTIMALPVRP